MAAAGTSASADVMPVDFSTPVGLIRSLIPDVELVDYSDTGVAEYMFSDAHLTALYSIATGEGPARIFRAAAAAMRALAVSEALIQKVIRTEDLQTDGAKLATALLAGAKQLEDRADSDEEDSEVMMIVDFQPQPRDFLPFWTHGFPGHYLSGRRGFGGWIL